MSITLPNIAFEREDSPDRLAEKLNDLVDKLKKSSFGGETRSIINNLGGGGGSAASQIITALVDLSVVIDPTKEVRFNGSNGFLLTDLGGGIAKVDLSVSPSPSATLVGTGRTITVNGTAGNITSTAGAQDLSADRTWTLNLATTAVTPGSYTNASITVDSFGRLTAASSGAAPALASEAFVTIGNSAGLSNERALTGTSARILVTDNGANSTVVVDIASTYVGQASITTLGTIATGVWQGTKVGLAYGGTNADLSATGGAAQYLKQSSVGAAITVGTIPASDIASGAALTRVDDTNITLVLGGSPTVALLAATSLTLGWAGTLAAARLNANVVQSVVNDTNVTGSIAAQALTLGWTGTLADSRLSTTAVTPASYGSATQVGSFTVGATGRLTAAANVTIAIPSTAVTDFNEAAQDAIGLMVDATLVYVDATPLLTRAALTGDITAPQASNVTTLATVNANVGSFGSATAVGTFTVNGKGLITAAANVTITPAVGSLTGRTDLAGTTNQVVLSASGVNALVGGNAITLSLPQDIHTGASPTFVGLTLSGLTHAIPNINGSGVLSEISHIAIGSVFISQGTTTVPAWSTDIATGVTIGTAYIYRVGGTDVALADGGTNASLTASNGGIFYSTATAGAILAGTATAGLALVSGASTTPSWFTPTAGSVLFAGTGGILQQDNANLFWDDTNNRMGIGTTSPSHILQLGSTLAGDKVIHFRPPSGSSGFLYWAENGVSERGVLGFLNGSGTLKCRLNTNSLAGSVIGYSITAAGLFGIGVDPATAQFHIVQTVNTSGSPTAVLVTCGAHTTLANFEAIDFNVNCARTVQYSGAVTLATQRAVVIQAPTYSSDTATKTITTAVTLDITGAPIAGTNVSITNPYGLRVAGGIRCNGNLVFNNTPAAANEIQMIGTGGTMNLNPDSMNIGTSTSNSFGVMTNGTNRLVIDNTGIVTTSPTWGVILPITVNSNTMFEALTLENDGVVAASSGVMFRFKFGATEIGRIGVINSSPGALVFWEGAAIQERIRLDSGGIKLGVSKTIFDTNGLINKYNNISTVSNGVPSELATIDLTAVAAAKAAVALYTPVTTGMFRISVVLTLTQAATTSSVLAGTAAGQQGVSVGFQTGDGSTAVTQAIPLIIQAVGTAFVNTSAANTVGTTLIGSQVIYANTTAITYNIGYTSVGVTPMQYSIRMKVEAL